MNNNYIGQSKEYIKLLISFYCLKYTIKINDFDFQYISDNFKSF